MASITSGLPAATYRRDPAAHAERFSRHARSFHLAARFLGRQHFTRVTRLYSFCRHIDDLVDRGTSGSEAHRGLDRIEADLDNGGSADPRVDDFLALAQECVIDRAVIFQFLSGIRSDIDLVDIADTRQLVRYCYRVAGTVGLMMCDVLDVIDERARPHAVDLGIAMQLTNIARDVLDDAKIGRRYLPTSVSGPIEARTIAADPILVAPELSAAVRWLLAMAEGYYRSGEAGLYFLAARPRLAALVAARVYRAIGLELAESGHAPWKGRAVVPFHRKIGHAAAAAAAILRRQGPWRIRPVHDSALHTDLEGLPGGPLLCPRSPPRRLEAVHG